ncbi:MAG: GGDEF domain-containing protein [Pseudomonadota bacterium]
MKYSKELLEQILLLTSIKEQELLVSAFFKFMLKQFESIKVVALYKLETTRIEEDLKLEEFITNPLTKDEEEIFNQEILISLQKVIRDDPIFDETVKHVSEYNLCIFRANADSHSRFFIIYQFSSAIPESVLIAASSENDSDDNNSSLDLELIHYLSKIYSNHQTMISLNDKDALTGLYNRKSFDKKMNNFFDLQVHKKYQLNLKKNIVNCLAILDIDYFKNVNDTFGHLYGDEVLLHFSQQMQAMFRDEDLLFRYGGEEFTIIFKNIELKSTLNALHRFRKHIENYSFPKVGNVTVSIGLTQLPQHVLQTEIVDRADHALYYVKNNGRNNVGCYEDLVEQGAINDLQSVQGGIELF